MDHEFSLDGFNNARKCTGEFLMNEKLSIEAVIIGDRARRDSGDLNLLAESIAAVGLLQPPIITAGHQLISGGRRIMACKLLGHQRIPVRIAETYEDASRLLFAQSWETSYKKPFLPSEAALAGRAVEAAYIPGDMSGDCLSGRLQLQRNGIDIGILLAVAAASVDLTLSEYKHAKAVMKAAECHPERFARVVEEMDRSGDIEAAYRQVKPLKTRGQWRRRMRSHKQPASNNGRLTTALA
jgi:ParB-like chromosome segregation protein Spo0J